MDISVTIITSIAVALIYVFIIKPKKDKKAAEMKENQTEGGTEKWIDDYGVEFSPDKETLLKAPAILKAYSIPKGVISVRSNAFDGCVDLKSVTFPDSVRQMGRFVFNKCDSLSEIHIPAGKREWFEKMLPADLHNKLIEKGRIQKEEPAVKPALERKDKYQLNEDFQKALMLNDSGRSEEAFELMKKTADAGHTRAQFNTGVFYAQGHGVEQDYSNAVIYYSMAAMLGDRDACYNIGLLSWLGQGVKQPDYEMAFSYFMTAAQLGDYLGMAAVSYCYSKGKGTEKDEEKANEWRQQALNTPGANVFSIMQVSMVLDTPDPSNISYSE